MAILKAIKSCVVKVNGVVDIDSTVNKVCEALAKEMESTAHQDEIILKAVMEVFNTLGTNRVPTPRMVTMAAAILSKDDLIHMADWSKKVEDYLNRGNGFTSQRGRNGGLSRA